MQSRFGSFPKVIPVLDLNITKKNLFLQEKVEGKTCNQCKKGYFGLSASNPAGCIECYCSGLSIICSEATGYRLHTVCIFRL